jgi:hypothetical protein
MNLPGGDGSLGSQARLPVNIVEIGHVDVFGSVVEAVPRARVTTGRGGLLANRPGRAKMAAAEIHM